MIKIILVDDHEIFLDGLESVLIPVSEIEVIARAKNGKLALGKLESIHKSGESLPDVMVVDINMPELDGVELTKLVKKSYPEIQVLALTMYDRPEYIRQLRKVGVNGYILKEKGKEELVVAIKRLAVGKSYYSQEVMEVVMDSLGQENEKSQSPLSKREIDVLILIGKGMQRGKIADKLSIAENTVETHRRNILGKLGLNNSLEIVAYAIANEYVIIDPDKFEK